ncbi:MAG: translation initiation factor IF-2 [Magnetococcus sp. WYHC-3]
MSPIKSDNKIERPPIVVVMGHIDHGKSTLLDYIRKTNIVADEAGGITQHISAYELVHKTPEGKEKKITFLDTPGHEAFGRLRERGASVADIAILVVSAEDGMMPQTKEALNTIIQSDIPYIVAINKIDTNKANVEKTKQSLAENDVLIEEYGGKIPAVAISAKTGKGIDELLDMLVLVAEMEEMKACPVSPASGFVIEAHRDRTKGISAVLVIKNGILKVGDYVSASGAWSPVRTIEDFSGKKIETASCSSPVTIFGWSDIPEVGREFKTFGSKREAEDHSILEAESRKSDLYDCQPKNDQTVIPVIIKTEVSGTIEAIEHEINKINCERTRFVVVDSGPGHINETDIKRALSRPGTIVVGFGTEIDERARTLVERFGVETKNFNIIYDISDWLKEIKEKNTPKIIVEELLGRAKILKKFNAVKGNQVAGGQVNSGEIALGGNVNIIRDEQKIGTGEIKELQINKTKADKAVNGDQFGIAIATRIDIEAGDYIESVIKVEK